MAFISRNYPIYTCTRIEVVELGGINHTHSCAYCQKEIRILRILLRNTFSGSGAIKCILRILQETARVIAIKILVSWYFSGILIDVQKDRLRLCPEMWFLDVC